MHSISTVETIFFSKYFYFVNIIKASKNKYDGIQWIGDGKGIDVILKDSLVLMMISLILLSQSLIDSGLVISFSCAAQHNMSPDYAIF